MRKLEVEEATPLPRLTATVRFAMAVLASAAVTLLIIFLQPRQLSVVTDIVGYPTYRNFNYHRYFWRYYLAVLFFPALATGIYHLIGLRWREARWPDAAAPEPAAEPAEAGALFRGLPRVLVVAATLGVALALFNPRGAEQFWGDVGLVAVSYTTILFGAAVYIGRKWGRPVPVVRAILNGLSTSLTVVCIYAASEASRVTVLKDGSVNRYPWMPGWVVIAVALMLLAGLLVRSRQVRDLAAALRLETTAVLFIAGPILIYVGTAGLAPPFAAFDTYHHGELLAGAQLFDNGAFPWRDTYFIHGLLQDVFTYLVGLKLIGGTAWAGSSGLYLFAAPLWWVANYVLLAYALLENRALLLAAAIIPLLGFWPHVPSRLAPLPLVLLALAALLHRGTWLRSAIFAFALIATNILVPELAYAVPACAGVIVAFEISSYRKDRGFSANFPRTLRSAGTAVVLLALWFAWLGFHGAAGRFLGYYMTFARDHALTGAIPQQKAPGFDVLMLLTPVLVLLAFWYVVAAVRMRKPLPIRDWMMLALSATALLYYVKFLSRSDLGHVAMAASVSFPLFYYEVDRLLHLFGFGSRRALAIVGGAAVIVTLILVPAPIEEGLARIPSNYARVVEERPALERLGWSLPTMGPTQAAWLDVGRFLEETIGPDDAIFDFTNQPALYHFLLHRRPATRYYHVSLAIRRDTQLELIDELERSRPPLVVFDSESGGFTAWDGLANEVRHYEVSRYLLRHYRPYAKVHGELFYARIGAALRPPRPSQDAVEAARACDWGEAPRFLRSDWLEPAARAEPRDKVNVGRQLVMSGWASDPNAHQPAAEVVVIARGAVFARAVPARTRADVAADQRTPGIDRYGFSISEQWIGGQSIERTDLRVFGISRDGKAWPLAAHWEPKDPIPSELLLGGPTRVPVVQGAATGWVDFDDLSEKVVAAFEFPPEVQLAEMSGLEFDVQLNGEAAFEISDRPSKTSPMSFEARGSGLYRVMLDNCPQWYGLHGHTLYLRHDPGATVRGLRLLKRKGPVIKSASTPWSRAAASPA
jgi:hypothetical protein